MKSVVRYWGRKPPELVEPYIKAYSHEGEVVLDPFAGSGSFVAAALQLKRRAIYIDLNPVAKIIARATIIKDKNDEEVKLQKRYKDLYMINGKEVEYYIWEGDKIVKAKLVNGSLIDYQGGDYEGEIAYCCYPKDKLYYNNGKSFETRRGIDRIDQLYTRRNLLILLDILKDIPLSYKPIAAFISILYQASKMARLNAGSWGVPCYWIPHRRVERNPYLLYERAYKRIAKLGGDYREGTARDIINHNADVAFYAWDATDMLFLHDNSVDLVVTDPPFYDEIQYFELSYLAAAWLYAKLDFEHEIVVNRNRGIDEKKYLNRLAKALLEIQRVLKDGRYAVIMFHEEDEERMKKIKELISCFFTIEKEDKVEMKQRNVGDRDTKRGKELRIFVAKKE